MGGWAAAPLMPSVLPGCLQVGRRQVFVFNQLLMACANALVVPAASHFSLAVYAFVAGWTMGR